MYPRVVLSDEELLFRCERLFNELMVRMIKIMEETIICD